MRTPALSWVTWSATFDFCHRSPHLHMFLLPVVCHSPPVVGSPPQTGSCNPTLGPLRLEGDGSYLNRRRKCKFLSIWFTNDNENRIIVWRTKRFLSTYSRDSLSLHPKIPSAVWDECEPPRGALKWRRCDCNSAPSLEAHCLRILCQEIKSRIASWAIALSHGNLQSAKSRSKKKVTLNSALMFIL